MNSIDYGRLLFLFHWFTVTPRIRNLLSKSLKSIFFIEGERALGWCFLHISALKSSLQKSKLQAVIPLPLFKNQFFVIFTKKVKFGYFFRLHGVFPPPDISALLPRPAFGLQILYLSKATVCRVRYNGI